MTRTLRSSLAIATVLSLSAQPAPAQSYNPKELSMHWTTPKEPGKAPQPSSLSEQRGSSGGSSKYYQPKRFQILSAGRSNKRRLQAR
jgi:hypothetical protein